MTVPGSSSFWHLPSTMLGRLAVGLAAVSVIMFFLQDRLARFLLLTQIPAIKLWLTYFLHLSYEYMFSKGFMVTFGLIAGIIGFFAVIRKHERSWLVWMIILLTILVPIAVTFLNVIYSLLWTLEHGRY